MRYPDPHDQLLYVLSNIRRDIALLDQACANASPAAREIIDRSHLQHLCVEGMDRLIASIADVREHV